LEIFISIGFISYLTYQQTKISKQQLAISRQQEQIIEFDHKVSVYEHSARFNFVTTPEKEDSAGNCLTEALIIENRGYPIRDCDVEIYSFVEVQIDSLINSELKKINTEIIPVDLYYSIGSITDKEKGVLAAYSTTYNCKTYFEVQNELQKHVETYYWTMNRFNLVEIKYMNFLGENDTVYLCDNLTKADLEISSAKAKQLLKIYNGNKKISIYNFTYNNLMKLISKR